MSHLQAMRKNFNNGFGSNAIQILIGLSLFALLRCLSVDLGQSSGFARRVEVSTVTANNFTPTANSTRNDVEKWQQPIMAEGRRRSKATQEEYDEKKMKKKVTDGCYHVFLDVGSNIGVHNRFLFEPKKYPLAEKAISIYKQQFGKKWDNRDICAVSFEPNPNHYARHLTLSYLYSTMGWRYIPIHAGVADTDGTMTFYHRNVEKDTGAKEVGFSSVERNAGATPITIPVLRLSTFLVEEVRGRKIPDKVYRNHTGPKVVMKMDIESQEYSVLPDIITSGALCSTVDFGFGELHKWENVTLRSNMTVSKEEAVDAGRKFLFTLKNAANCKTVFKELDDETYLRDGVPLPTPPRKSRNS